MACVRAELGTDWLPRYLVAPVRRFWLAPGVMSAPAWVGVLMPSIDGVGRYFPLTIAAAVTPVENSLAAALAAREWYRSVDATARKVLDVRFGIDDLEDELAHLTPWQAVRPCSAEVLHLADAALDASGARARSVWWCGDAGPATALGCYASLPPVSAFGLLLAEAA
jgi:type VI secretion system protein ImpM